jgi:hypothetical protein
VPFAPQLWLSGYAPDGMIERAMSWLNSLM